MIKKKTLTDHFLMVLGNQLIILKTDEYRKIKHFLASLYKLHLKVTKQLMVEIYSKRLKNLIKEEWMIFPWWYSGIFTSVALAQELLHTAGTAKRKKKKKKKNGRVRISLFCNHQFVNESVSPSIEAEISKRQQLRHLVEDCLTACKVTAKQLNLIKFLDLTTYLKKECTYVCMTGSLCCTVEN